MTPRAELAALAASAATAVAGVAGLRAGTPPVFVTDVGASRVAGVSVVAGEAGRYEITLCVAAHVVPLHELADAIREAVIARARAAELDGRVGTITVRIDDVVAPIATIAPA